MDGQFDKLVSVLMTAYNREKYIAEAIESVLASTYTNFELIIVDDCSTDKTVEIARSYEAKDERVKVYVNEKNLGDYPNRNRAASYARGKYIKYVDSDDVLSSDGLEIMVSEMDCYPDAGIGIIANDSDKNYLSKKLFSPTEAYRLYFYKNCLLNKGPSGVIIRTDIFREYGGFSNDQFISDTDLWLRMSARFSVLLHSPDLLHWREHDQQQIAIERRNPLIEKKRYINISRILNSKSAPLSEEEANQIIQNIRSIKVRSIFKELFSGEIRYAWFRYKMFRFGLYDLLNALKKNRIVSDC